MNPAFTSGSRLVRKLDSSIALGTVFTQLGGASWAAGARIAWHSE